MKTLLNRREWLVAAVATSRRPILGAHERIRIGVIGSGDRGTALIREVERSRDLNVTVTAVCDVYRPNRERAAALVEKAFGERPRTTVDYQELLGWADVDAVIIATPDLWHCPILIAAIKAGKDVYVEKPLGNLFSEVREAYLTVKASDRIVQVGTQYRSHPLLVTAAEYMRQGILGKVTRVEAAYNVHAPRWARPYEDVKIEDVAWEYYRRPWMPEKPDVRLLRQWQLFRKCTDGIAGLWMSHLVDTFHWFTGHRFPLSAVTQGGVYLWKDGRETADVFYTLLEYPECIFSWAMNLTNAAGRREVYYGERGILDISGLRVEAPSKAAYFSGEGSEHPNRIQGRIELKPAPINSHMANFIECIRTRKPPRADIEAGFSHAVACLMASTALDERRVVRFDPQRLEIL